MFARCWLTVFILLSCGASFAADNLNCAPPPPLGPLAPNAGAGGIQGWTSFNGHQTVAVCTLDQPGIRIPSAQSIDRLECVSEQILSINDHQQYRCPLGTPCGVGIFSSPQRKQSSAAGFDVVCITYSNTTSNGGSAGLGFVPHKE
jgi:hypothetical protein